jgi:predicted AAA+ superfamily ATPase
LPEVIKISDKETKKNYIKTLVEAIIFKDIVQRYNIKKTEFLENLLKYTYATTTSNLSINAILKYLKQEYKTLDYETVNSYLDYATTTFLLRNLQSIGDKTKYLLKGKNKFYGIDTGIRNVFSNNFDISKQLENFVYIELLRRGNTLNFLDGSDYEIDFVANNGTTKQFFQVATTIKDEKTFLREVQPFFQVKQQYKKTLLTLDDTNDDYQ